MCPACLAAAATSVVSIAAGVSSVGGLAAIVVAHLARRPGEAVDEQSAFPGGEDNDAADNRDAR
jgi:hypothetical protein